MTTSLPWTRQVSCVFAISTVARSYPGTRVSAIAIPQSIADVKSRGLADGFTYSDWNFTSEGTGDFACPAQSKHVSRIAAILRTRYRLIARTRANIEVRLVTPP